MKSFISENTFCRLKRIYKAVIIVIIFVFFFIIFRDYFSNIYSTALYFSILSLAVFFDDYIIVKSMANSDCSKFNVIFKNIELTLIHICNASVILNFVFLLLFLAQIIN